MTKKQRKALASCSDECIGKSVFFKHKGKSGRWLVGTVEDVVSVVTSDYNHMIQRIKLCPKIARKWEVHYAYRTCYYTLTKKTRKPIWGQFHALVSERFYRQLAQKVNQKGWLGTSKA